LWQLSRESVHYARIAFLLSLAIGIGWFATSFRATVRNSQIDQAHYIVGADARIKERDTDLKVDRVRSPEFYLQHPDIKAASSAYRIPRVNAAEAGNVTLLAVDPTTFGDVSLPNWRNDLGNIRIPYLPETDVNLPTVGIPLPESPQKINFWARLDAVASNQGTSFIYEPSIARLVNRTQLGLRLQDSQGTWFLAPATIQLIEYLRCGESSTVIGDRPGFGMRAHVPSGWAYFEVDLTQLAAQPVGELRLASIYWDYISVNPFGEGNLRLLIAEFTTVGATGESQFMPIFEDTNNHWEFLSHSGATTLGLPPQRGLPTLNNIFRCEVTSDSQSQSLDASIRDVLVIPFTQQGVRARMGINVNYPTPFTLQAIMSQSIHDEEGIEIGEDASPLRLTGIGSGEISIKPAMMTEYFPTLYNRDRFIVVDVRELLYFLNYRPIATYYPNEIWLEFNDDVEGKDQVQTILDDLTKDSPNITTIDEVTYVEEFDNLETDPLALGLLGLMFLAFIIALILSIVGLLTYSALTAQARRS
jgi:hypothetical protein